MRKKLPVRLEVRWVEARRERRSVGMDEIASLRKVLGWRSIHGILAVMVDGGRASVAVCVHRALR